MAKPWDRETWAVAYDLAMLEVDIAELPQRIENAKSTIASRMAELLGNVSTIPHAQELACMNRALHLLQLLQEHAPLRRAIETRTGGLPINRKIA